MNIYTHKFAVRCPNNNKQVFYELEIHSGQMIYVEKIVIACELWECEFHEKMADHLAHQFPNTRQFLRAHHHGVDVETVRGEI